MNIRENGLLMFQFFCQRLPLITIIMGRMGIALAGVVSIKISTTLLSPAQFGSISQLNSLVNLFNMSLIIPVTHFMTRGFLDWQEYRLLKANAKKYFLYILVVAFFSMVLSGLLQWKFDIVSGFGIVAVMMLVMLNLIAQPLNLFGTSGHNILGYRKINVLLGNIVSWSALCFSVLLFLLFKKIFSWSVGQLIGYMVGGISVFFLWKRLDNKFGTIPQSSHQPIIFSKKNIFIFSWPFVFTSLLWWIQTQSYRFILERIQGISEVGLFATAYALAAMPIILYEGVIGQYLEPLFLKELKLQGRKGQVKAWNKYAMLYLPGMVITGAYVASATPFLTQIFLGPEYRSLAIEVTVWAAIIETMRGVGSMMFQLGMAKVDNRMTIVPALAGAIIAPLGVFFLGKIEGVSGTIAGLLLAAVVVLIINIVLSRAVLPISWPFKQVLYGLLLIVPVIIGLRAVFYFFPQPGFLFSFIVLLLSGLYVAIVLLKMLGGQGTTTANV